MKKSILILITAVGLFAYQAFGQATVSVTGQNLTATPGSTIGDQLTLTISGTNSIGNVESVNMLLKTFAGSPGLNGSSFFTISNVTPTSPFTLTNSNSFPSAFNAAGDSSNSGATVSDPTKDMGSNAPSGSAPSVGASGTTAIPFETVTFSLAANTPAGVYNFSATAGGFTDNQGSFIDNTSNQSFDINSEPKFTITVVPEPATWSLFGLGALGALGLNLLRVRRKS